MPHAAEVNADKVDVDRLIDLTKQLEGVKPKNLKLAFKAINYPARVAFRSAMMNTAVAVLGICVSGLLVIGFIWLGYQLVLKGHPGWCVTLCGIPLTSVTSIFVLKKTIATQAMNGFVNRTGRTMNAEAQAQVPPQSASPAQDPAATSPGGQSAGGTPAP
ncbi:hypothetical protein [Streptomyces sp. ISL-100]|uniref:hypothetical protein n=1 Tax=Streptomyces sp. ISL-100 TaxID=2819173 RepID=UPI001BEAA133|nr:hypothetical protein [Streptomyces sp. ISL-100]MBT2399511.1 hypothetical protein [Streptomyces sp. ISL-100]